MNQASLINTGIVILLANFVIACTTERPPSNYLQATPQHSSDQPPPIVEVVNIAPLPGQLKVKPEKIVKKLPDQAKINPKQVVQHANKKATKSPSKQHYFNAIMQYNYAPGALYQVYAAPLKLTDIQLQPGEKIIGTPAAGDTLRWIMGINHSKHKGQEQQHVYIKPTQTDLTTTLSINTDKRTYLIELHSFTETYMAAVNWRYPHEELANLRQQQLTNNRIQQNNTASKVHLDQLNFNYSIHTYKRKKPSWTPIKIFDDGHKTFIQFPKSMIMQEAPTLFVKSKNSRQVQLVNYRVKNDFYIVDRLFDIAELRLGQKNQIIVQLKRLS